MLQVNYDKTTMAYISTREYPIQYLQKIQTTLKNWTDYILQEKNFSFVKFGDGEFFCMMGMMGANCDNHLYSPELGNKLLSAWDFFHTSKQNNIFMAEWAVQPGSFGTPQNIEPIKPLNNPVFEFFETIIKQYSDSNIQFVNFEILLQNTLTSEKFNFFKSLKNTKRKKIFIGPSRLEKVNTFLNTNLHIQVPLPNSFDKYNEILNTCKNNIEENCLFLFSSGMPTKALISELLQYNNNITCLDTGSSFDALFVGGTREGQLDTETLKEFYKELL